MNQEELIDYIDDKRKELTSLEYDKREYKVTTILEEYFDEHGRYPDPKCINKLTNIILYDNLEGDTRSNKMQAEEYPVLSEAQYLRRTRGDNQKVGGKRGNAYVEMPLEDTYVLETDLHPIDHSYFED